MIRQIGLERRLPNIGELSQTGATAVPYPRKATRAKGNKILEVLEQLLLEFIKDMEKDDWKYGGLL